MAYIYRIGFDIDHDDMKQLRIGASLERALGYLRTLLPNQDGFISARAMHTLEKENPAHLVFESTWETWEDFKKHIASSLAEDKILKEFEPHIKLEDLSTRIYEDVN
ncbi:MAG: hypothetical protein ACK2TV_02590 [Anaerolineales bacterium]